MPDITIDPGAVQTARVSLLIVRDTLNGLYSQHQNVLSEIEGILNNITTSAMEAVDPFGIWERFGFNRASYSCLSIRGALEQVRGDTGQAIERLCETHPGQLAKTIENHSGELRSAIASALDSLWTITSLLDLGNIGRIIKNPGLIREHFDNSRGALHNACTQAQTLVDYLTRLRSREERIIAEITDSFTVILPSLECSPEGSPTTFQTHSDLLQEEWSDLLNDKPLPAGSITGERAAIAAQEVSAWLKMGYDDVGIYGYNHIDWSKVPGGVDGAIGRKLQAFFNRDTGDWIFGNNPKTPDVQCVAFVIMAYQFALGNPTKTVMPAVGDARNFWKAYANNAVPGWTEVTNKVGSAGWPPRVGDIMVTTANDHVAIVTSVTPGPDGSVTSITITQANGPTPTQTYDVKHGEIGPGSGIDGFLRYGG